MAAITQKLYFTNTSNATESAAIYDSIDDVGDVYTYVSVNGKTCYVPLVPIDDKYATSARVEKNGIIYAIGKVTVPKYGYNTFTSAGTSIFEVPSGVTKLRVTCVGGGAGGVTVGYLCGGYQFPDSAGGATSFGIHENNDDESYYSGESVVANGAGYATFICGKSGNQERITSVIPGSGTISGSVSTMTSSSYSGAPAVELTDYKGNVISSAGAGGMADGDGYAAIASGSSGYKTIAIMTVKPKQKIRYTVGYAGYGCWRGTYTSTSYGYDGEHVSPGSVGAILVEWGKGID